MEINVEKLEEELIYVNDKISESINEYIEKNMSEDCDFFSLHQEAINRIPSLYKRSSELSSIIRLNKVPELSDISEYGDHMTLEEFKSCCNCGGFIDYDGSGNYATATEESDISIYPSDITEGGELRTDFTHVVWYNK